MERSLPRSGGCSLASLESKDLIGAKYIQSEPKWMRRLFSRLDSLEVKWPSLSVYFGVVLELVQLSALLFTNAFVWGPLIQLIGKAVQCTILPLWSNTFLLKASFDMNAILVGLLGLALVVLYILLFLDYNKHRSKTSLRYPQFTKILLYLLIGPLFLPCLQLLLAFCVCTGGNGTSTSNYVASFPSHACFGRSNDPMVALFCISLVIMVFLFIPKIVISVAVYEDSPLSDSVRARSHSLVEAYHLVYISLLSVLGHYLVSIGMREAFAGIFAASSFVMAALHVFYIPFYDNTINQIRVIGYSILFFSGLLMVIELDLGPSSAIYGETNLDVTILVPGALVIAIITYGLAHFRVSSNFRRDVARARHGEIHPDKFKRRMFFPYYLPTAETSWFYTNGWTLDARNSVVVKSMIRKSTGRTDGLSSSTGGGGGSLFGCGSFSQMGGSSSAWDNESGAFGENREIIEMNKFEMTCYLDSVYCATDVELATRFLIVFSHVTKSTIPNHLLEYGMEIYNKGLNRFVRNAWLQLQFAIFLCTYYSKNNYVSMAFCEELDCRQLSPILTYRLHRRSKIINDHHIHRAQAARHYFMLAIRSHKESLVHMQLFWKRMACERVSVTMLAQTSLTIISGCERGGRYYRLALEQKLDAAILTRYAQFVEDIALDSEAADYAREMAAEMTVREEEHTSSGEVQNDSILSSQKVLSKEYGRISRQLRVFLVVMFILMLALMTTIAILLGLTFSKGDEMLDAMYAIAEFRYNAFSATWLAAVTTSASQQSSLWDKLENSITNLRSAFEDLTYGQYKDILKEYKETPSTITVKMTYEPNKYPIGDAGFWRAGEIFISALESLILYRTSDYNRDTSQALLERNTFFGFSEVFNATANNLQNKAFTLYMDSLEVVMGLFVGVLLCAFVTFFVFRYYLIRITGIVTMALNLFRLIPQNSLELIAKDVGDKLEHFEDADKEVEKKVKDRMQSSYLSKIMGSGVSTSGGGGGGVVGQRDRSLDSGVGVPVGVQESSGDRSVGGNSRNTISPVGGSDTVGGSGLHTSHSRTISQEIVDRPATGFHPRTASGGSHGTSLLVGSSNNSLLGGTTTAWKGSEDGQGVGSKFDLLARNSSIADVGRIKMHMGQYEPPYPKGFFVPRQLSEVEAKAREEHLNEVELEANLAAIRTKRENGKGGPLGTSGEHVEEIVGYTPPVNLNASRDSFRFKLTLGVTILVVCVAVTIGVLDFILLSAVVNDSSADIPLLQMSVQFEQTVREYITNLEGFIFLAAKTLGVATTADFFTLTNSYLNDVSSNASAYRLSRFSLLEDLSTTGSSEVSENFQIFYYYLKLLETQLLSAAKLACNSFVPPESSSELDCSFFSYIEYDRSIFHPNQTLNILFDSSLELPTSWAVDSQLTLPAQAQMATNVLLSPYYAYTYNQSLLSWKKMRDSVLSLINTTHYFEKDSIGARGKSITLALSIVLSVLVLFLCFQSGLHGSESFSFVAYLVAATGALTLVVLHGILYCTKLPNDGTVENSVAVLSDASQIYNMMILAKENVEQCALADNWNGAVQFALSTGPTLFASWNDLFERLGSSYFSLVSEVYSSYQTSFYLLTISLRLAIAYLDMPTDFANLPIISTCDWNFAKETYSSRIKEMYLDTPQLFYSTTAEDLALPASEQKDLAYSLVLGPWEASVREVGRVSLFSIVKNFVDLQLTTLKDRFSVHYPLIVSCGVISLVVTIIGVAIVVFLVIFLVQVYSSKKSLSHTNINSLHSYDRSFSPFVHWSSCLIAIFIIVFTILLVLVIVNFIGAIGEFLLVDGLNLREVRLWKSDIALEKSLTELQYAEVAVYFAERALFSSSEYNRLVHLDFFSDLPPLLFGGVDNITNVRYRKSYALNTSVIPFEEQSALLAFNNYVDPSLYNWQQRTLEMSAMTAANREIQQKFLQMSVYDLANLSFHSTKVYYEDVRENRSKWFASVMVIFIFSVFLLVICMLYMIISVVQHLREEEEGTQVLLRMIPRSIRQTIPAISHYMTTGRIVHDNNAVEIEQMSKDLSVVPIVTINTLGKIRQFSRAAEETFLWTRSEAMGQNVNILMPDNIAEEHDRYLQNYLKTGIKFMVGNTRPIRAKRKDGTLFSAMIEVTEYHNGTELLFVSAIHVSQEALELEKSCELSQSFTDASIIPIVVIDSDGVIQVFNKASEEAFKTTAEEVVGQKVNMLMPRQEAEYHDSYLERYFRVSTKPSLEMPRFLRAKRTNGEIFPIRLIIKEFQIAGRTFFAGYLEDITSRLRLEVLASAGEIMQEESPVPIIVTDMDGVIQQCSKSIHRLCGISSSELLHRHVRSLIRNENVLDLIGRAKSSPRGYLSDTYEDQTDEFQVTRHTEEGGEGTFQARITSRLFQWHTKGMHLLLSIEDLTTAHTLDLNCRIGNAVMAMSSIPILVVQEDGLIKEMSPAAEQTFRCFASDMYNEKIDILFDSTSGSLENSQTSVKDWMRDGSFTDEEISKNISNLTFPHTGAHGKNPVVRVLTEYQESGSLALCGRKIAGVGRTVDYGTKFPVEVIVIKVGEEHGEEGLFLVYIRNSQEDHRLLEVTRWNDAFMAISPIATVCASLDGKIFACSDSTCEYFGWQKEELIGESISILMPSHIAEEHEKYMQRYCDFFHSTFKEGPMTSILNRRTVTVGLHKNGKEFPVVINLRDKHIEGADSFLIASIRSSQQDVALDSLSKVSSTMSSLSPCPFISINAQGIVLEFSRSAQETFGYSEAEVVGHNVKLLQTPEVASLHDGYLRAYEKTGLKHVLDREVPVIARKKDGSLLNVDLSVKEIRSEYSLEYVGYLKDVTIKKTGKQLHVLDELIDSEAASPMVELDGYGVIRKVRYLEAFGFSVSDLVGKNIVELVSEPAGFSSSVSTVPSATASRRLLPSGVMDGSTGMKFSVTSGITDAERNGRTWAEMVIEELLERSRAQKGTTHTTGEDNAEGERRSVVVRTTAGEGGTARGGSTPWVSRRLWVQRKRGKSIWCEVVFGEATQPMDPLAMVMAGANKNAAAKIHPSGGMPTAAGGGGGAEMTMKTNREDRRIVAFFRNLDQEMMLELYEGINYTGTDLYPIPLLTMTLESRIMLFNRAAEETFGYLTKDTIGELLPTLILSSEHQRMEEAVQSLQPKEGTKNGLMEKKLEEVMIQRKGSSTPVCMTVNMRTIQNIGKDTNPYILVTFHESTSETASATEDALTNVLLTYSAVPSLLTDHTGKVETFSSGAESLLGYSKVDVEGQNVEIIRCYVQSLQKDKASRDRTEGQMSDDGRRSFTDFPLDFLSTHMSFTSATNLPISLEERVVIIKKNGEKLLAVVHVHSIMPYKKKVPLFIAYFQDQKTVVQEDQPSLSLLNLMEGSLSGVVVIAVHGVVTQGNKTASNLLGYSKEEFVDLPVSTLLPVDYPGSTELLQAIRYVIKMTGENTSSRLAVKEVVEGEIMGKDGRSTEVQAIVAAVLPSAGREHMRVVINFVHIAGKKKVKVFEDREAFLEQVSGCMVFELDTIHQTFLYVSNTFLKALEWEKPSDVLHQKWESFVPSGDGRLRSYVEKVVNGASKGRERYHTDTAQLTFVAKSGKSVKVVGRIRSVEGRDGNVCSLLGSFELISLSRNQLSQLAMIALNENDTAVVLCTVDGSILSTNEKVYQLFSIAPDISLVGTRLANFFPTESEEETLRRFEGLVTDDVGKVFRALRFPVLFGSEEQEGRSPDPSKEHLMGSASELHRKSVEPPSALLTLLSGTSKEEETEDIKDGVHSATMWVEVKVEPIRGDDNASSTGYQTRNNPSRLSARGSRRSSDHSSADGFESGSTGHHSSLLLVRMRRAVEKHREALLRAAAEIALVTQNYGTFTMDTTGIIRSWGPRVQQLFCTPSPVGADIGVVLLAGTSGEIFRELLQEFRRSHHLGSLQGVILMANCYASPLTVAATKAAATVSSPLASTGTVDVGTSMESKWAFFGATPREGKEEEEMSPFFSPTFMSSTVWKNAGSGGGGSQTTSGGTVNGHNGKGTLRGPRALKPHIRAIVKVELTCKESKTAGGTADNTELLCYIRKIGEEEVPSSLQSSIEKS